MQHEHPTGDFARAVADVSEPDAHGQAALLLAESILHALVEKGVLTNRDAMTIVEVASEVKVEVAELAGESKSRMKASLALLATIEASFETDRPVDRVA